MNSQTGTKKWGHVRQTIMFLALYHLYSKL